MIDRILSSLYLSHRLSSPSSCLSIDLCHWWTWCTLLLVFDRSNRPTDRPAAVMSSDYHHITSTDLLCGECLCSFYFFSVCFLCFLCALLLYLLLLLLLFLLRLPHLCCRFLLCRCARDNKESATVGAIAPSPPLHFCVCVLCLCMFCSPPESTASSPTTLVCFLVLLRLFYAASFFPFLSFLFSQFLSAAAPLQPSPITDHNLVLLPLLLLLTVTVGSTLPPPPPPPLVH